MKRAAPLAACALLLLTGCETAMVPLAAYTAEGLSYASTGKGIADHAISAAEHKDCALLHVTRNGGLCAPDAALERAPALAMIGGDLKGVDRDPKLRALLARAADWKNPGASADAAPPAEASGDAKPAADGDASIPFN